jgi:myo-inositol 2-dehydrogenase/D-chiro-inositol 1-dehydrogenase
MGARHAANIHLHSGAAEVAAVTDANPARAVKVAAECGAATLFDDGLALIADADVDAVIIASPDATHAELAVACIEAGKPVLCEKPLGTTVEESRQVLDAEVAAGRRLVQVGFMRRYDPDHVAVKRHLDARAVGKPLYFRGWHRNPAGPPYLSDGDMLIAAAVHDLYSARWLLQAEIEDIYVRGTVIDPARRTRELQLVVMTLEGGRLASVEVNKDSGYGYEVGVEVVGSTGTVTSSPLAGAVVKRGDAVRQDVSPGWLDRFAGAYRLEVEAWVAAATEGRAEGPSAWDGYATLVAAAAGVQSLESGIPVAAAPGPRPTLYS